MQIGLIGGIGPAATEFYYRALVKLYAEAGRKLALTIIHADLQELVGNMQTNDQHAQARIFAGHIDRLKAGGCEAVALTSMGAHFCIEPLASMSSLPLINALPALQEYLSARQLARVGILGTRAVMGSRLYGLGGVEVVAASEAEQQEIHAQYTSVAAAGKASDAQRRFFEQAAAKLVDEQGADAVVLGGTDLFLAFDQPSYPYPVVDCALVHAQAIARIGMA
jgi:aspartate racemase